MSKETVFVTGATSGIGLETAKVFADLGHPLIINGRRQDRLDKLRLELSKKVTVNIAPFDVSDREEVDVWFNKNESLVSNVGILVNNAGLARGADLVQNAQVDDWEEMIDVNVKGLLYVTRRTLPHMIKKNSGHIINLGSVAGRYVYPGGAVYCATKFSVRAISEGLRMDLLGKNIRVCNIEPGMVETEFSEVRFRDKEKASAVYKGMTPLTPKNIADTISWVVQQPAHVNIQELVIYPTDQASVRDVHRA